MPTDRESPERNPAWLQLLKSYRIFVGFAIVSGSFGLAGYLWFAGMPEIDIVITQNMKVGALALALSVPPGVLVARPIVDWLYSVPYRYLVVLGLEDNAGVWKIPPKSWSDLEVENQLHRFDETRMPLYSCQSFDPEKLKAVGTWRGTLSDRDLLRALHKIDECRNILETDAQRGFAIESQAFSIVRSATRSATMSVVETFEAGTLPDEGEGISDAIEKALAEYDLEADLEDIEVEETESADPIADDLDQEFVQEASADD